MALLLTSLDPVDFVYSKNFSGISTSDIATAIAEISADWYGVLNDFWSSLPSIVQTAKRNNVFNLLVAWHLADLFPSSLNGVVANGGMPILSKNASGVELKMYKWEGLQEQMVPLTTNTFGIRALQMIQSAPERFGIKGSTLTPVPTLLNGPPFGVIV